MSELLRGGAVPAPSSSFQKGTEGMPDLRGLGRWFKKESPSFLCLLHLIIKGEGRAEPAEPVRKKDNYPGQSKTRRSLFPESERTEAPLALCEERLGRKI